MKHSKRNIARGGVAFTLIELLLVIAIIAIPAAMLLLALSHNSRIPLNVSSPNNPDVTWLQEHSSAPRQDDLTRRFLESKPKTQQKEPA